MLPRVQREHIRSTDILGLYIVFFHPSPVVLGIKMNIKSSDGKKTVNTVHLGQAYGVG